MIFRAAFTSGFFKTRGRFAILKHLMLAGALLASLNCPAADDAKLASALSDALKFDKKSLARVGSSADAIRGYIAAGYLAKRPNIRVDYTDYWWLKTPAPFMGHELVMIEEEYQSEYVGCCVSPGIGITVRINGSPAGLERFAQANKCSIDTNAKILADAKQAHVALDALTKGHYATLSCRERDIESGGK